MASKVSIKEMVASELRRDPGTSIEDLHFLAGRMDEKVQALTPEEFERRYVPKGDAPPKRRRKASPTTTRKSTSKRAPAKTPTRMSAAKTPTRRRSTRRVTTGPTSQAARVRAILHEFAEALAGAESPAAAVRVMAGVDDYVERIVSED